MPFIKNILARNFWLWIVVALIFSWTVNEKLCMIERGKYLLGIFYNGFFQNSRDGMVYSDYLKSHGITHEFIKNNI